MGQRNNLNGDDNYDWLADSRIASEQAATRRAIERESAYIRDEIHQAERALTSLQNAIEAERIAAYDREYFRYNPRPVDFLHREYHSNLVEYVDNHTLVELTRGHLFKGRATENSHYAYASEKKTEFVEPNLINSFASESQRMSVILFSILISIASFWWLGICFYAFWSYILNEIDKERKQRHKFTMYSEQFQAYVGAGLEDFAHPDIASFYAQTTFTADVPPDMPDNHPIFGLQAAVYFWANLREKILKDRKVNVRPYARKKWRELLRM